ncbi:MAG TPA: hypothetical protein DCY94_01065, partial [Firmicutes bacterium]|nr:hypothetical protein [Bacillota bacterium]
YDLKYTIFFQNLLNTFVKDELVYKLESLDTGDMIIDTTPVPKREHLDIDVPIKQDIRIEINETHKYKLTVTFLNTAYDQSSNRDAEYYMTLGFTPSNKNKVQLLDAYSRDTDPLFSEEATTDEGIYSMEDDYGTSYYYRGDVKNNYVKFAGFYWRIVRLNGDGTLRIIYDGTQAHENGENSLDRTVLNNVAWNELEGDAKYSGYMFGASNPSANYTDATTNAENSNIKNVLDAWYKENIEDRGFGVFVADAIFCNDRSLDNGSGFGNTPTRFGGFKRLRENANPSFTCPNKSDAFTVSDTTKGNVSLEYPVGLLTGDEAMAAGLGAYNTGSTKNYLYKGSWYWTMTPDSYADGKTYSFYINGGDIAKLKAEDSLSKGAVAPVINLTKEYAKTLKGTGTMTDPFTA